jgi:hypothetical protein
MEKLMEIILDRGIQNLRNYGSIDPVAFIICGTTRIMPIIDFSDKDLAIKILRRFCREYNADKVIIMAEVFSSCDLSGICPNMASDREECIIITGEDVNGDSCGIVQPFYRDKKGMIKLKDKIKQVNVSPLGRFSNILRG